MGLSVAEKIRLIMKRQKITMGDLAEASGQTRQNLSNKMTRGNFTEKDITELAAVLYWCGNGTVFIWHVIC